MLTRQTESRGVILPAGVPMILRRLTFDHIVVEYEGKRFRLRRIENRIKIITSEMAKVLFHENS